MVAESGTPFEARLTAIFEAGEGAVADRLAREKARAEALQATDTRRLAYTLTEAIEHELKPAVQKALASYDEAIDRPILPDPRLEGAMRSKIGHAVDAAMRLAIGPDQAGPWKPLLAKEAPALRERLLALADAHFVKLGKARKAAARASNRGLEAGIRIGIFLAGLVAGAFLMRLLAG